MSCSSRQLYKKLFHPRTAEVIVDEGTDTNRDVCI
jgi:hypothetical protein